jgi:hypothetical protein
MGIVVVVIGGRRRDERETVTTITATTMYTTLHRVLVGLFENKENYFCRRTLKLLPPSDICYSNTITSITSCLPIPMYYMYYIMIHDSS